MADEIDNAADRIEAFRQSALAAVVDRPQGTPSDGVCKLCGEQIESDRLAVQPNARHCAECASAIEEDRARAARCGR